MTAPKNYEWLDKIGILPKMVTVGLGLYGIKEVAGAGNNPQILEWAKETGLNIEGYNADSIPWCGLFMAVVAKRAGYEPVTHPLWALNWGAFGKEHHQPVLGDVLTFIREGGGHVGIYVAEDSQCYHVLGGNTSDAVGIARIVKSRLKAARSPVFKIGAPASAKPYVVAPNGKVSTNES